MMKSVILLLMILGVGGWVLSHSASYIAHRRAAHGPLTRDFFHGNSEIPRHSARPWRRPSSSWITGGTGPPGVRWTPARRTCAGSRSRTVTSCSGLVSFLLETWAASRSAGVCPSCPRVRCPSADRRRPNCLIFSSPLFRCITGAHRRSLPPAPGVSVRTSPLSMALQSTKRARGPIRRSGPALLQYGHRITFPHWKGFGMFSPLDRNICLVYYNTYVRFQGRETPWT